MAHHDFLVPKFATGLLVTLLILCPPASANSPVLDIDGNPLEVGSRYYVLTLGRGAAGRGGLIRMSRPQQLCPTFVAQLGFDIDRGMPVRFNPPPADSSPQTQINEGQDINIAFGGPSYCRDSGVWKLSFDESTDVSYVATNGDIESQGAETRFKIVKTPGELSFSYKIVYCFLQPVAGIVANNDEESCQQLDAIRSGPGDLSFLTLVPLDQSLPFFGFVFKKFNTTTAI